MTRRRSVGAAESDGDEEEEEEEDEGRGGLKFEPRGRGGGAAGVRARWEAGVGGEGMDAPGLGLMGLGGGGGSFARSRFGGAGERSADERDVNILSTDGEEPVSLHTPTLCISCSRRKLISFLSFSAYSSPPPFFVLR